MALPVIFRNVSNVLIKNAPTILTVVGCVGVGGTAATAVKATADSIEQIEQKERIGVTLSNAEKVALVWTNYIPTATIAACTIVCIVGANSIHLKREAALGAAYILTKNNFKDYKEAAIEKFGLKKAEALKDDVAQKQVIDNPPTANNTYFMSSNDTLMYDPESGRYFRKSIDRIEKIENELNARIAKGDRVSVNDVYFEWGVPQVKFGDCMGWDPNENDRVEFVFHATITDDNNPCIVIEMDPKVFKTTYDYYEF